LLKKDFVVQELTMLLICPILKGIFGKDNGLEMIDGPLSGLHSRALIITDAQGTILYTDKLVRSADEPNYELH
jgi:peroxiredoxin